METKIKICGISRDVDAEYINEAKPDYTGFIIGFPKSRRNISEETAKRLRAAVDSDIKTVGVFVDYQAEKIAELANSGVINIIQLHGHEDERYISALRSLTVAPIWKSFIIRSRDDTAPAKVSSADMVLLDGGLGGGKVFDHTLAQDIGRPFILAGGLNMGNMREAIDRLHPFALDISSGVETDGAKDRAKIIAAVDIVRNR